MNALVDTDTGEVVQLLNSEQARELTDDIRDQLETAWTDVVQAYERQAWRALGYESWDAYTAAEFGAARLRLPREERQDVVQSLTEAGLSTRAIAAATGQSHTQVQRDRKAGGTDVPPEPTMQRNRDEVEPRFGNKVKGLDGKQYSRKQKESEDVSTSTVDRSPKAAAKRREQVAQMIGEGYRNEQIASKLGINRGTVTHIASELDIETVNSRLGRGQGTASPKLDAVADGIVQTAAPSELAVEMLTGHYQELDPDRLADWVSSLDTTIKTLRKIRNAMHKELTQ